MDQVLGQFNFVYMDTMAKKSGGKKTNKNSKQMIVIFNQLIYSEFIAIQEIIRFLGL